MDKQCRSCNKRLPLLDFYAAPKAGKYQSYCKACVKEKVKIARRDPNKNAYWSKRLWSMKKRSRIKGMECQLSVKDLRDIFIPKTCFYCGVNQDIYLAYWKKYGKFNRRFSFDRKDNKKGYTINNVVLACLLCNVIKSSIFSESQMKLIGKGVRTLYSKK